NCDFYEDGHANNTVSTNYFSGISYMPLECGAGGAADNGTKISSLNNFVVDGNYAENLFGPPGGGGVAFSVIGGHSPAQTLTATNNYAEFDGSSTAIGIELDSGTSIATGNYMVGMSVAGIIAYSAGFDIENNNCPASGGENGIVLWDPSG